MTTAARCSEAFRSSFWKGPIQSVSSSGVFGGAELQRDTVDLPAGAERAGEASAPQNAFVGGGQVDSPLVEGVPAAAAAAGDGLDGGAVVPDAGVGVPGVVGLDMQHRPLSVA